MFVMQSSIIVIFLKVGFCMIKLLEQNTTKTGCEKLVHLYTICYSNCEKGIPLYLAGVRYRQIFIKPGSVVSGSTSLVLIHSVHCRLSVKQQLWLPATVIWLGGCSAPSPNKVQSLGAYADWLRATNQQDLSR